MGTLDRDTDTTYTLTNLITMQRLCTFLMSICMLCTTLTFGNLADICGTTQKCEPRIIVGIVTSPNSTLLSPIPFFASCFQENINSTFLCVLVVVILELEAIAAGSLSSPTSPVGIVIYISRLLAWLFYHFTYLIYHVSRNWSRGIE